MKQDRVVDQDINGKGIITQYYIKAFGSTFNSRVGHKYHKLIFN